MQRPPCISGHSTLIDDVLDIARIEARSPTIEHEPIELDPLIEEALTLVTPLAAKRQIRLQGPAAAGTTLAISADRQRALPVALNLLSNAIKYNVDGAWMRIDTAGDGAQALQCLQETPPDLVLLDLNLPGRWRGISSRR